MEIKKFSVFEAISYAFRSVVDNFRFFFILFLSLIAIMFGIMALGAIINAGLINELWPHLAEFQECKGEACASVIAITVVPLLKKHAISLIASAVLSGVILAGVFLGYIKTMLDFYAGKTPSPKSLFSSFHLLPKFIVAALLFVAAVVVGLAVFIVPGIYIALRLRFFSFFIVDKDASIAESLKLSWRATQGQVWDLLGLALVCLVVFGVTGGLAGLFAFPIMELAYTYVYHRIAL